MGGVYAVRERELRRKRNGEPWLRLTLGDASGSVEAVCLGGGGGALRALPPRARRSSSPASSRSASAGGRRSSSPRCARPRTTSTTTTTSRPSSEVSVERLESDLRELLDDRPEPPAARAARPLLRRGLGDLGPLPRRAGGEGLPPGLPPRAARAHALGRPGGQRRRQLLPRHRPRRRRHRRAPARHRQDRGLQRRPAGDRPHRRRPPAGRDPARLLHGAPPDRGDPRLRPRARPGGPPHHPQPPRLARARLAGRPRHPRGRPRPHDRQPRRPPRQLRPPRAPAPRRRVLVGLRPRALGLGLLRQPRRGRDASARPSRPPRRPSTRPGTPFSVVLAARLELDLRADDEVLDGAGDEHLAGLGQGADPGADVDRDAGDVVADGSRTRRCAGRRGPRSPAAARAVAIARAQSDRRAPGRRRWPGSRRRSSSPRGPGSARAARARAASWRSSSSRQRPVAELGRALGGADDVGEQHGEQLPVGVGLVRLPVRNYSISPISASRRRRTGSGRCPRARRTLAPGMCSAM